MHPFHQAPVAYVSAPAARAQLFYELIQAAQSSILFQMYLFAGNDELSTLQPRDGAFQWAHTFADWLIERKESSPELEIVVILDTQTPDNPAWTNRKKGPLVRHRLEDAGIPVLNANLFRTSFDTKRRFPPAMDFHVNRWKTTPAKEWVRAQRSWQTWHNVEDHRKNLVIDGGSWAAVTSHNFIDIAAKWHENVFLIGGAAARNVWEDACSSLEHALELPQRVSPAVREHLENFTDEKQLPSLQLPMGPPSSVLEPLGDADAPSSPVNAEVQVLSNCEIRPAIIEAIQTLEPGGSIYVASTYFSDLELLNLLIQASQKVKVKILIDSCEGLPLGRLFSWVVKTFVNFRCILRAQQGYSEQFEMRVHQSKNGEMMHLKTAAFVGQETVLIGGQANYTPNSFSAAWLETNLVIKSESVVEGFLSQFNSLWMSASPTRATTRFSWLQGAYQGFRKQVLLGVLRFLDLCGYRP